MGLNSCEPRVLIVEDEAIIARDIAQQLAGLGYKPVATAGSGELAIQLASELLPDLVLMDIQLSGPMDGISAAQIIRAEFSLPVVFLTAFAADEIIERAKMTEPFGYILKPFSLRELRVVLEMALYKSRVEAKLRLSTAQLKLLSRRVLEVQEAERRRVAAELHDELGQLLTALKINLQLGERCKGQSLAELNVENIELVDNALHQVRHLAMGLRPSMLDDLGLVPALKWLAEQSTNRTNLVVDFKSQLAESRLAYDIETACFRIVQESLTNIARHAIAQKVTIHLQKDGDTLQLSVQDDGCGFDLLAMRQRAVLGGSIGVLSMEERAILLGGELDIQTAPNQGCKVLLPGP